MPLLSEPVVVHQCDEAERWNDHLRGKVFFSDILSAGTTPTATIAMGLAELHAGGWIGRHCHDVDETYYVLSGYGTVALGAADHALEPGAAVFVPAGVEHGVRNVGLACLRLLSVFAADSLHEVEYRFDASDRPLAPQA